MNIPPTILVIFGISGDLARRKLLPAINQIAKSGILPKYFKLIGVSRRQLTYGEIVPEGSQDLLHAQPELYYMDLARKESYDELREYLQGIETEFGKSMQKLFYLSIPPSAARPVIELLGESGIANQPNVKLLLEKPFGTDLTSASELVESLHAHFKEEQLYRIDHYMAKEMAQNIVVFRGSNSLFKRTWNKDFLERIEIIASETIGIEGRTAFYEQTGALRDLVQSHLLQLAALVLMELPEPGNWQTIPAKRLAALQQLRPPQNMQTDVVRGQYAGYHNEIGYTHSATETFVSLQLTSEDPRWQGVPVVLTTGKMLDKKTTEIRIRYKQEDTSEANELILRIQPNEGIEVCLWAKEPGYDRKLHKVLLKFAYDQHFEALPEAYERVFVDAMRSDHTLFATSEEVLATWRLLEPIQDSWQMAGQIGLKSYHAGMTAEEIIVKT